MIEAQFCCFQRVAMTGDMLKMHANSVNSSTINAPLSFELQRLRILDQLRKTEKRVRHYFVKQQQH